MTPKIHLVAFPDRQNQFVFVAIPNERGRYLRTDRSVVLVSCPHCHSQIGEPCKGSHGYNGGTHYARRGRLQGSGMKSADYDDLLHPEDIALPVIDPAALDRA